MGSSTNTRNFGIRRFTNLVREGRFRAPASGTELRLGTLVEIDSTDTDRIRQASAVAVSAGGNTAVELCGLLWYEHDSQTYEGVAAGTLMQDFDTAPNGRMVQVLHGKGAKVTFRNTADSTTEPGLNYSNTRAAVTMVTGLGGATPTIEVGNLLGWNNTSKAFEATSTVAEAVLRVTAVDNTLNTCDAELIV